MFGFIGQLIGPVSSLAGTWMQGKVDKALNTIRRDSETAAISAARKQVTQELNTLLQSEGPSS